MSAHTDNHPHHDAHAGHGHHHAPVEGGVIDPVCGMTVDPKAGKPQADYQGRTYYFCCNGCRTKFLADPQKYLHKAHEAAAGATDPVCGMSVDPGTAKHSAELQGQTYYFCCNGCKTKFVADPQKYL